MSFTLSLLSRDVMSLFASSFPILVSFLLLLPFSFSFGHLEGEKEMTSFFLSLLLDPKLSMAENRERATEGEREMPKETFCGPNEGAKSAVSLSPASSTAKNRARDSP